MAPIIMFFVLSTQFGRNVEVRPTYGPALTVSEVK